jgi:hypothetical protein
LKKKGSDFKYCEEGVGSLFLLGKTSNT